MQNQIRLFQEKNPEQVRRERQRLQKEYHAHILRMDQAAHFCRLPAMARLAEMQRDYGQQAEELLKADLEEKGDGTEHMDRAEAVSLYAEFAMDFATQAVHYAMIAALRAIELQTQEDENLKEGENRTHE